MLKEEIPAEKLKVRIFFDEKPKQLEHDVNKWLIEGNKSVFNILYQHCFSAWDFEHSACQFSVAVVYTYKEEAKSFEAEPIETLHFRK